MLRFFERQLRCNESDLSSLKTGLFVSKLFFVASVLEIEKIRDVSEALEIVELGNLERSWEKKYINNILQ